MIRARGLGHPLGRHGPRRLSRSRRGPCHTVSGAVTPYRTRQGLRILPLLKLSNFSNVVKPMSG